MALEIHIDDAPTGQAFLAKASHEYEEKLKAYLLELFPEPFVFRHKVTEQSKGLISSRTLANCDCAADDDYPLVKLKYNGKVCYERDQFVAFLLSRLTLGAGVRRMSRIDQIINGLGACKKQSQPKENGKS